MIEYKDRDDLIEYQERTKRYNERRGLRDKILQNFNDQMEIKQVKDPIFYDLIEDYMTLWDVKNELTFDIKERGVSVRYQNGPEQWGYKKNESVAELNRVNTQMMKVLNDLKIKPEPVIAIKKEDDNFEL